MAQNYVMNSRPSWDDYFVGLLDSLATRATCDRGKNSALIAKNKRIVATGYVGAPAGLPHCDESGHLYRDVLHTDGKPRQHCVRTTHSEANAIAQAAHYGISIDGATLYTKLTPCLDCTKLLINAGIKRVVAVKDYHASHDSKEFLKQAGIELVIMTDENATYENMQGDASKFNQQE